jgi:hypothetical protein
MPCFLNPFMNPIRASLIPVLASLLLAASGCLMQPNVSVRVTVADGSTMDVPLTQAPAPVTDGVVTVKNFQFAPWDMGKDKPKAITFTFVVGFAEGAEPASVVVDDFTEQPILEIFADKNAHVVKDHLWGAVTLPFAPQDEHVKWVLNLDNNVRVYRFTIKLRDGTTHVLLRPIFVPAQMKDFMRTQLGVKGG